MWQNLSRSQGSEYLHDRSHAREDLSSVAGHVLKNLKKIQLDEQSQTRIRKNKWLMIMESMLAYVTHATRTAKGQPESFAISTLLSSALQRFDPGDEGIPFGLGVLRVVPWKAEVFFLPVNHGNYHWSLIVISRKERRFLHVDSLACESHSTTSRKVLSNMMYICENLLGMFDFSDYQL